MTPVKLIGSIFTPIWSGSTLSKLYERFNGAGHIGESWETSAEPGAETAVDLGGDGTIPFSEYLRRIGASKPPLVKLLDASAPLSIQVHPDETAAEKLGSTSKSEIWYVLAAEDGASILYGTKDGATSDDVKSSVIMGNIESVLRRVPVKPGDIYMIPPGMIHSLGAGITVLEVQDRAGTTYRVKDIAGNRETHVAESLECIRIYSDSQLHEYRFQSDSEAEKGTLPGLVIADTIGYAVSRYASAETPEEIHLNSKGTYMFCEKGGGISENVSFTAGDSLYFPSGESIIKLDADSSVIFVI